MNCEFWVGYTPEYSEVNNVCKKSIERYNYSCYNIPSYNLDNSTNPFILTRFLSPLYSSSKKTHVIFCDDDFLWLKSPTKLLNSIDLDKPINVCKHPNYISKVKYKMDGKPQYNYPRKNWSSLIVFNVDKYSLSTKDIFSMNISDLHRFNWIDDSDIGEIPLEWNWLVGEYEENKNVNALHYTLGGPWYKNPYPSNYNKIWNEHYERIYSYSC